MSTRCQYFLIESKLINKNSVLFKPFKLLIEYHNTSAEMISILFLMTTQETYLKPVVKLRCKEEKIRGSENDAR